MRWRRRGGVVLGAASALLVVAAVPASAAPAPAALPVAASLPAGAPARVPVCATAVSHSSGTATSAPVPLPPPASDAGGSRLGQPGLQVQLRPGTVRPPRVKATAWIVADLATGDVVAACNAHVPLAPASTMKILTALALHPRLDPKARYRARPEDAAVDGTKVGLSPRSVYTVDDLWHGLLLGSGNDTAGALAALAGGMPVAAGLMTETARSLGARDTVVRNTSGLDARGQVSSVYDLALFGRALLRDPALATIVRRTTYAFPSSGTAVGTRARRSYQIQNHNRLLLNYPGTTGVKNGYTTAAGASLVVSATRGGRSYVVAMLRSDVNVWRIGEVLLDWAFAQNGGAEPVGRLDGTPVSDTTPAASPTGPAAGAPSAPPTPRSVNRYEPAPAAVPPVVAPVRATLQTMPQQERTIWLLAALAVALAGGAVVRRLVHGRTGPAARRSSATTKRPARSRPAKRPAAKGRAARPARPARSAPRRR